MSAATQSFGPIPASNPFAMLGRGCETLLLDAGGREVAAITLNIYAAHTDQTVSGDFPVW
jgi:hypothetical protein